MAQLPLCEKFNWKMILGSEKILNGDKNPIKCFKKILYVIMKKPFIRICIRFFRLFEPLFSISKICG